ncbi:MAG: 30S ribosomal protein S21 [Opitutales bacterium]|nr:30S ribosomal protein S21 [Opitutales bacterium]HCI56695.1 30S ribosomal protein S21 [Opitutae bacterium]
MPVEVKVRKGEPLERALRRLKVRLNRENILKDCRSKRFFEKPCQKRRLKEKAAKFNVYLRQRRDRL